MGRDDGANATVKWHSGSDSVRDGREGEAVAKDLEAEDGVAERADCDHVRVPERVTTGDAEAVATNEGLAEARSVQRVALAVRVAEAVGVRGDGDDDGDGDSSDSVTVAVRVAGPSDAEALLRAAVGVGEGAALLEGLRSVAVGLTGTLAVADLSAVGLPTVALVERLMQCSSSATTRPEAHRLQEGPV